MSLLVKKPLLSAQSDAHGGHLKRVLGPVQLTALGIGAVIGAGIFVSTGSAAKFVGGPALMLSYVVAGTVCLLAALCYAEYAAMTPVAGSAYTYAYTTLGEIFAWIIGWDLILEYAVGAATVAAGWSQYFQKVLKLVTGGYHLPPEVSAPPFAFDPATDTFSRSSEHFINLPAVLIALLVTAILVKGIQESARANAVMVAIKLGAVLFVILVGAFFVNPANWEPFAPFGWTSAPNPDQTPGIPSKVGMMAGAAIIFFAYIGFDAVSTQSEEAKNPQRDVPIGIIGSLVICTILYIGVVAVLTGMVRYDQISKDAGVADAFAKANMPWAEFLIAAAGVAGITSVLLVMLLGSARILMAIARDGLLPRFFADVHPTFQTPWKATVIVGVATAVLAGLFPVEDLEQMTNIGTLFAFAVVCGSVLVLRFTSPGTPRPFKVPLAPVTCVLGVIGCILLMASLPGHNWLRLGGWMLIGLVIYFLYGRRHSLLNRGAAA